MSTQTVPTGNKCAHPACNCPVEPGQEFCSSACERAPDKALAGTECHCNHQSCALAAWRTRLRPTSLQLPD